MDNPWKMVKSMVEMIKSWMYLNLELWINGGFQNHGVAPKKIHLRWGFWSSSMKSSICNKPPIDGSAHGINTQLPIVSWKTAKIDLNSRRLVILHQVFPQAQFSGRMCWWLTSKLSAFGSWPALRTTQSVEFVWRTAHTFLAPQR